MRIRAAESSPTIKPNRKILPEPISPSTAADETVRASMELIIAQIASIYPLKV
jgi:hypothetical protein